MAPVADHLPFATQRALRKNSTDVSGGKLEIYRDSWQRMMQLFGRLHAAGVPLVAGTDSLAGFMLHRELELYVQAGVPAGEAIRIATENGARYAGVLADRGTIERGKRADLILVDGDPDEEHLGHPQGQLRPERRHRLRAGGDLRGVRDPPLRRAARDHPLSAAGASRGRRERPRPADRVALHEVDAHRARRLEHGDVLDLLGDQPEVQLRAMPTTALTIAWLTESRPRSRMKEPSILR